MLLRRRGVEFRLGVARARVHGRIKWNDLSHLREEKRKGVLGNFAVKDSRQVDDDDAKLSSSGDVKVVEADAEGADCLQVRQLGEQLAAHRNRALVDRVDVLGDRQEIVEGAVWFENELAAGRFELGTGRSPELLAAATPKGGGEGAWTT